jgi:hypothetical protein
VNRASVAAGALVALVVAVGCASAQNAANASKPPAGKLPRFKRAVVVVFENKPRSVIAGSPAAPTFNRYARRYASLKNYKAVTHPSLPNYLALVSGSTQGITDDCTDCTVDAPNLADSLEAAGLTWKTYAEDLPYPGFTGATAKLYVKWHNPLVYFKSVYSNPGRLRKIVPFDQFAVDLRNRKLPTFSLVVPNFCNDVHDCPVATGDAWLGRFLRPLLGSPQLRGGVVFVVFDEGSDTDNRIFVFAAGNIVRPHAAYTRPLTHYGLLATLEASWHLRRLGRSASARPITGIWR